MAHDNDIDPVTRRRILQLTGATTVTGMMSAAGCLGGGSGDETDTPADETEAPVTTAGGVVTEETPTPDEEPQEISGEVVLSQTYDPISLDPGKYTNITDMQIANNIFDALTNFKLGTAKLTPGLATEWTFTGDNKTSIELSLREGVKFHKDWGELTAGDVLAHFERMNNPDTGSPQKAALDQVKFQSVETMGDYGVRLNFGQPPTVVPYLIGQAMGMIPPADAVDEKGRDFAFDPIGTGPFQFVEFEPETRTVLEAFEDYYRSGMPRVERAVWRPIPESQTAWSAFKSKEIDVRRVNSAERLQELQNRDDVKFTEAVGLITRFAGINNQVEPFTDKRVRQAMNYAANTESIVESVFPGMSRRAKSFIAPGVRYQTSEGVIDYSHDPDKAESLLADAGYGDGFETTWWVPDIGRFTKPATVLQNNFAQVGIDVEIQIKEVGAYVSKIFGGEHDVPMFTHSLGQEPVPDSFMFDSFHSGAWPNAGSNYWLYENEQVDQWLEEVVETTDDEVRRDLFTKIERQVTEDAPGIWYDHEKFIFPTQDYVEGFTSDPMRRMELDTTSVTK